jgi:hypothetical protein
MKNRSIFSLITILAIATMFQSCTRIDAGHVGLKVSYYGSDKGVTGIRCRVLQPLHKRRNRVPNIHAIKGL